MKSIFATSLVIIALLTVFRTDIAAPLSRALGVVAGTSLVHYLPFDWQHAYAETGLDQLDQERERVRYQWATSALEKERLEAHSHSLHQSVVVTQTRLQMALTSPNPDQVQIAIEVRKHDQYLKEWQDSKDQLIALNATLQELDSGEQKLSEEIQTLDHRLHMVRLQHVNHSAKRMLMEKTSSRREPSSLGMLEHLEKRERIESIYLDRFPVKHPDHTNSSAMERAREIIGLNHLDS